MPAFTHHPGDQLRVSFFRGDVEIERRIAHDGAAAVIVLMQLLASLADLQSGDSFEIEEAEGDALPAVSRSSHYN
jgi:hypothetical protein